MRERVNAVDSAFELFGAEAGDALCGARHAADGAENPDFVACGDAAVVPAITHEGL
jgi:hypothetical protein